MQRGINWKDVWLLPTLITIRFPLQVFGKWDLFQPFSFLIWKVKCFTCLKTFKNWHATKCSPAPFRQGISSPLPPSPLTNVSLGAVVVSSSWENSPTRYSHCHADCGVRTGWAVWAELSFLLYCKLLIGVGSIFFFVLFINLLWLCYSLASVGVWWSGWGNTRN